MEYAIGFGIGLLIGFAIAHWAFWSDDEKIDAMEEALFAARAHLASDSPSPASVRAARHYLEISIIGVSLVRDDK